MHIFNMSVTYLQNIEKDPVKAVRGVDFTEYAVSTNTVVPRYKDYLYNVNFDFGWNFFWNGSFLIKIHYIITEFTLADTDGDSWR